MLADERLRAMAIYTLTRMGKVTTSYASALKKHVEADFPKDWKADVTAAYLGSTLALLKQTDKGRAMLSELQIGAPIHIYARRNSARTRASNSGTENGLTM